MWLSLNDGKTGQQFNNGWEYVKVEFDRIEEWIRSDTLKGYCSNQLSNGSRAKNKDQSLDTGIESYAGGEYVLILDIDEAITIPMAVEIFKGYRNIIITTKSHKAWEHRFRVFIELEEPIMGYYDRIDIMKFFYSTYSFVDQSCKNANRLFYTSPINAECYKNLDGKKFSFKKTIDASTLNITVPKTAKQEVRGVDIQKTAKEGLNRPLDDIFRFNELTELWSNDYGEVLEGGEVGGEESSLKGATMILDSDFYKGQRNHTLFRVAKMLVDDGLNEDTIADFMMKENDSRDGVPLNELMAVLRSATK